MKALVVVLAVLSLVGCTTTQGGQQDMQPVNRTIPEHLMDVGIEHEILRGLSLVGELSDDHRVAADAFRGEVLLTGEVSSQVAKQAIENMVLSIRDVKRVYNRLVVDEEPKSQSHTLHENYLKAKLSTKILTSGSGIKPNQYKLVVRDDIAYFLAEVNHAQSVRAHALARETAGIRGFVHLGTVFATPEELASGHYSVGSPTGTIQNGVSGYHVPANPTSEYVLRWQDPSKAP